MIQRFALAGSTREPQVHARAIGAANPSDLIEVTVLLRRKAPLDVDRLAAPMARESFARQHGADDHAAARVEAFAQHFNLTFVSSDLSSRSIRLAGTIAAMAEAFGTTLKLFQGEHGVYRGRSGDLYLPVDLEDVVVGVFGLDNRPQARSRCRRRPHGADVHAMRRRSFTPVELARLYGFPSTTGEGQTIAIIELGGGYAISDLRAYFERLGVPLPAVTAVSVDGAKNAPSGDPNSADGEVLLDIEVAGAIAPGARIVVYFAPNTDKGFLDAITAAIHDSSRKPSVVSISWGASESSWTRQALDAYDEAFRDGAALGVTVCCAAGDNGSDDGAGDGLAHVDFPAASPHVLACGGTTLEASGGTIEREVVWNEWPHGGATGGGVSEVFPRPAYQAAAQVPVSVNRSHFEGRGVPDVAGNADPATGYEIRVDGHEVVFGGTSAVAPLWAALIALRNEALGSPLGYANPTLYAAVATAASDPFRDITSGDNGAYQAKAGWDACTGLGSPKGTVLVPRSVT